MVEPSGEVAAKQDLALADVERGSYEIQVSVSKPGDGPVMAEDSVPLVVVK